MRLLRTAILGSLFFILYMLCPQFEGLTAAPQKAISDKISQQAHAKKLRRAEAEAAAYLFRYYNNKLSQQKADSYARYVIEASVRFNVEPGLIASIIIKESTAKENARSKYACGLMQVYWRMHRKAIMEDFPHIRNEKSLMEPRNNIMVGTWLFARYMASCKGNVEQALHRYLGSQSDRYVELVMSYRQRFTERVNMLMRSPLRR